MHAPVTEEEASGTGTPGWQLRHARVALATPLLMGILNVTPDSFSDGGRHLEVEAAVKRAMEMIEQGAGMIDIGGESTRPGAAPVPVAEEIARVVPVVRELKAATSVPISVDTRRTEVAREAIAAGADVINDVSGLGDAEMAGVVAAGQAGLVLMHMRGTPQTMQRNPSYGDVTTEVRDELGGALAAALAAGVEPDRIVIDPGIGFAKNLDHNLQLLAQLPLLRELGRPLLLGVSRKAFIGSLLGGVEPYQRDVGTAAACVVGLLAGVRIFRVHDVRTVREAITVAEAIRVAGTAA